VTDPPAELRSSGSSARTLARAGLIVTSAFVISRLLGYVRVLVITWAFGDRLDELDAFFAAFRIPDLMFQLVAAGALSSAVIPMVSRLVATGQAARAWRVVSSITTLMLVALAVLSALLFVGADVIVPAITPGFSPDQLALTIELTRIMLLAPIVLALGAVATSVLNARGRFAASAAAPIAYNLGIILGALLLGPALGIHSLAVGVVLGSLGHALVQLAPLMRTGFRYRPTVAIGDAEVPRTLGLMAPRAMGLAAAQFTFIAITFFASSLPEGSLTAFNIAQTLLQIPLGVIGVPLGIVLLPAMSREIATGTVAGFTRMVSQGLRVLMVAMLPIAAAGIVLRHDVVALLFGVSLSPSAVDATADTLAWLLLGLAAHSAIAVLARAFYAGQDTLTPVLVAVLSVGVNIAVAAATVDTLGLTGLALCIAVGAWVEITVLAVVFARRYPELETRPILLAFGRSLVASLAGAACALLVVAGIRAVVGADPGPVQLAAEIGVGGTVAALAYGGMMSLLRAPELPALIALGRDLLRRQPAPAR
jgi:putative peptidoglycan lipid II flippase